MNSDPIFTIPPVLVSPGETVQACSTTNISWQYGIAPFEVTIGSLNPVTLAPEKQEVHRVDVNSYDWLVQYAPGSRFVITVMTVQLVTGKAVVCSVEGTDTSCLPEFSSLASASSQTSPPSTASAGQVNEPSTTTSSRAPDSDSTGSPHTPAAPTPSRSASTDTSTRSTQSPTHHSDPVTSSESTLPSSHSSADPLWTVSAPSSLSASPSTSSSPDVQTSRGGGISAGVIAGVAVSILTALILFAWVLVCYRRKRSKALLPGSVSDQSVHSYRAGDSLRSYVMPQDDVERGDVPVEHSVSDDEGAAMQAKLLEDAAPRRRNSSSSFDSTSPNTDASINDMHTSVCDSLIGATTLPRQANIVRERDGGVRLAGGPLGPDLGAETIVLPPAYGDI